MPVWLQMTAALSAALISGLMGIALIPFLEKYRFFDSDPEPETGETASGNRVRPTMCGLLLIFGCISGLVLSSTLFLQTADRTSTAFQTESRALWMRMGYALLLGGAGFALDYMKVKRRFLYRIPEFIQIMMIFLLSLAMLKFLPEQSVLDFGFWKWNAGRLSNPVRAVLLTLAWKSMQGMEIHDDGIGITLNCTGLLFLTMILIMLKQNLLALYSLTAAGACMGCFYWNLPPAKCRLGETGSYWLGGVLPVLCLAENQIYLLLLYMAVYLVNLVPVPFRKQTLLELMKQESAWKKIGLMTGFAVFCEILSVMLNA